MMLCLTRSRVTLLSRRLASSYRTLSLSPSAGSAGAGADAERATAVTEHATERTRTLIIPILEDNYSYALQCLATGDVAFVDPAEPATVCEAVRTHFFAGDDGRMREHAKALLCTHHHYDHAGGNEEMVQRLPSLDVVATGYEDIPACSVPMQDGSEYALGALTVQAIHMPYHTAGHVVFHVTPTNTETTTDGGTEGSSTDSLCFVGDCLFVGGCGRMFEGTAHELLAAMDRFERSFPDQTRIFCGHEYTLHNLAFAQSVEPANEITSAKLAWALARREAHMPTIPSTLAQELQYNVFLRSREPAVRESLGIRAGENGNGDDAAAIHKLRELRNTFPNPYTS